MSDSKKAKNLNDEEAITLILCLILLALLLTVICSSVCIIPIRWSCRIQSLVLYNYGIFLSTCVPNATFPRASLSSYDFAIRDRVERNVVTLMR